MGLALCLACGLNTPESATIHRFPADLRRCNVWAMIIGRYDMLNLEPDAYNRVFGICSAHFAPEDLNGDELRDDAVPLPIGLAASPPQSSNSHKSALDVAEDENILCESITSSDIDCWDWETVSYIYLTDIESFKASVIDYTFQIYQPFTEVIVSDTASKADDEYEAALSCAEKFVHESKYGPKKTAQICKLVRNMLSKFCSNMSPTNAALIIRTAIKGAYKATTHAESSEGDCPLMTARPKIFRTNGEDKLPEFEMDSNAEHGHREATGPSNIDSFILASAEVLLVAIGHASLFTTMVEQAKSAEAADLKVPSFEANKKDYQWERAFHEFFSPDFASSRGDVYGSPKTAFVPSYIVAVAASETRADTTKVDYGTMVDRAAASVAQFGGNGSPMTAKLHELNRKIIDRFCSHLPPEMAVRILKIVVATLPKALRARSANVRVNNSEGDDTSVSTKKKKRGVSYSFLRSTSRISGVINKMLIKYSTESTEARPYDLKADSLANAKTVKEDYEITVARIVDVMSRNDKFDLQKANIACRLVKKAMENRRNATPPDYSVDPNSLRAAKIRKIMDELLNKLLIREKRPIFKASRSSNAADSADFVEEKGKGAKKDGSSKEAHLNRLIKKIMNVHCTTSYQSNVISVSKAIDVGNSFIAFLFAYLKGCSIQPEAIEVAEIYVADRLAFVKLMIEESFNPDIEELLIAIRMAYFMIYSTIKMVENSMPRPSLAQESEELKESVDYAEREFSHSDYDSNADTDDGCDGDDDDSDE